jgi:hypothetical protein
MVDLIFLIHQVFQQLHHILNLVVIQEHLGLEQFVLVHPKEKHVLQVIH